MFDRGEAREKLRIKDLNVQDRPREKLQRQGVKAVTNAELLAILIRTGSQGYNALEIAQRLLQSEHGSLYQLYAKLRRGVDPEISGLGPVKQTELLAAMELGLRTYLEKEQQDARRVSLLRSDLIYQYIKSDLVFETEEETWVIMLDVKGNMRGKFRVAQGGYSSAVVDIRIILRKALQFAASAIALVHNHPSGIAEPSPEDDELTRRLQRACDAIEVQLVDHIIYVDNKDNYYSYFDNGRL
ncbi:MAG: DNA repair protein RadC [Porphyromonas sp.]|nr:DNA repair protein RadC [Porphyromonas sp.]